VGFFQISYYLGLFGFTSLGGRFTLSNNQDHPAKGDLNKWNREEHFSDLSQKVMPLIMSDHCPFILDSG
jgi:hypothetical protein